MSPSGKRERNLPPSLLTVLYLPVLLVVAPVAVELAWRLDRRWPLAIVPIGVVGAYAWVIPRVRRL